MGRFNLSFVGRVGWVLLGLTLVWLLQQQPVISASSIINLARPTWDTGWFQAEVYRELLQRLGYQVSDPLTLDNDSFYRQVAEGKVDLWVNGWFPLHDSYLNQPSIAEKVEPVGFEVPGGAIQGYLIDRTTAERLNIRTLADLSQPNLAAEFDHNGNGKADLIGCNEGWACAEIIDYHLQTYGLEAVIEPIQGDYAPLMEETIERYRRGESILFYTWTPNWTVSQLILGKDVVWLEVPYASLPPEQEALESETVLTGIEGCINDPCTIGFPRNDIRAVANSAFLAANPAVRSLLEQVTIPLEDIAAQNARMLSGEGSKADIRRHAQEWLEENNSRVADWLATAQATADILEVTPEILVAEADDDRILPPEPLQVVTQRFEPFVIYEGQQYQGFSVDLWDAIATELDFPYNLVGVNSVAKLLDEVERGAADVAVAGIGITSQGEKTLDFSYPYYESGLQVMVRSTQGEVGKLFSIVGTVLRSPRLYYGIGIFVLILLIVAHLLWFSEHRHNAQFPSDYLHGIWEAFWWAAVTVTTVGYGDKVPQRILGRFFGLMWMFSGYFVFAYFTASIATTFTVQELQGTISGPEDLPGKRISTVTNSAAAEYLDLQTNLLFSDYNTFEETLEALKNSEVDAIVYDAPVLQHFVSHEGQGQYKVVGEVFQSLNYGIALQQDSPYRETINAILLKLYETGKYDEIYQEWFG
ncbi:MAG: glycine betaine/L-proline ABC transporter substrate-binding protein ProX [Leptolyngbya sp. SIO1D8]|nr:glycine betaine/L-proline ABC transporter substrate-binding protein ProX [Leptolyngbya sp. SIO1D8]